MVIVLNFSVVLVVAEGLAVDELLLEEQPVNTESASIVNNKIDNAFFII